jgi:hypothetical protein
MEQSEIKTHFEKGFGVIEIRTAVDEQAFDTLHQAGLDGLCGIMERSDKRGEALIVTYRDTTQEWINSQAERVSAGFRLPITMPEAETVTDEPAPEEKAASEPTPRRAFRLAALLSTVLQ